MDLTDSQLENLWDRALRDLDLEPAIESAYTAGGPVVVPWFALDSWAQGLDEGMRDFALYILDHPERSLAASGRVLHDAFRPADVEGVDVRVALTGLPDAVRVSPATILTPHMDKLVAMAGIVRKVEDPKSRIIHGLFECIRCGAVMRKLQDTNKLEDPLQCSRDEDFYVGEPGCGKEKPQTAFKLLQFRSDFIPSQKIWIQEQSKRMTAVQPRSLEIDLVEDLVDIATVGDRVVVNGIVRALPKKKQWGMETSFTHYAFANNVEVRESSYADVRVSDDEKALITRLAKKPNVMELAVDAIAPSLFGMRTQKKAVLFALLGGIPMDLPDGVHIRGEVHVLLVGDPGVAKSQLLKHAADLSPMGLFFSGKGATGPGLTVTAEQEDGVWYLKAGALVLAHKGLCSIDELGDLSKSNVKALKECMELGSVSYAKAGMTGSVSAETTILSACNPKETRFDSYTSALLQLPTSIDAATLSRFDIILTMRDTVSEGRDRQLAEHMAESFREGAELMSGRAEPVERTEGEFIPPDLLPKYLAHARCLIPSYSPEALTMGVDYYVNLRQTNGKEGPVAATPRDVGAVFRMAVAASRVRLSPLVETEDVQEAIDMMEAMHKDTMMDGQGRLDIDLRETGRPKSRRDLSRALLHFVQDAGADVELAAIQSKFGDCDADDVADELRKMAHSGELSCPRDGMYRSV